MSALQSEPSADIPSSQPPLETRATKISKPARVAAGFTSLIKSAEVTLKEPGLTRGIKALRQLNQFEGTDCPGCAWPDPDEDRAINEYCENGVKAIAEEATSKRITPDFFRHWTIAELSQQSDHWLGHQGRLTHPMVRLAGSSHYQEISWDDAFAMIAQHLNALASPDEAIFYTSGRTSNEAAFLYQLFVRQFGTNNLPDCSNMCHESSGAALKETIGVGKGTVRLEDFDLADTILIIGQNPGTNHPRMLTTLQKAARRGATIVSVNPLAEVGLSRFKHPKEVLHLFGSGTKIAKHFVRVRLSGDLAFFKGLCKEILEEEARHPEQVINRSFIDQKTRGLEDFRNSIAAASWNEIVEQSGIPRTQIREIAEVVMRSKAMIACWAMGLTQQRHAVATIQEVVNLMLLGGHLGRPGAGVCPVRGHSNVQGDRTMGIWEKMPDSFLDTLRDTFAFDPPRKPGWDVVESIQAMHRGNAKVFFAMGGNFLSATPDTEFTAQALSRCRLTVQVSTKLNRGHLITGEQALILPCLGRTDRDRQAAGAQFVTVENSMGIVHSSRGNLDPPSQHLMSEPAIVAHLAATVLGERTSPDWLHLVKDYDRIRDLIARVVPGFDDMNRKVRRPGGFYLPNAARDDKYATATGHANFTVSPLDPIHLEPGQFLLTTLRSHDQYNTTIYGLDDRYRGIFHGRRVVLLNPEDMQERGWNSGDPLDVTSHFINHGADELRTAHHVVAVPYEIPRRCAAMYFPEANVLVPIGSVALKSNTPTSKAVVVTFSRSHENKDLPKEKPATPVASEAESVRLS
ncbi:MAG TPA: FdhF/YdeP family oxidoreductase [Candidatus Acidoferrum sp.]|jgi:molybdopterin-dependent oxidoreductase alpha subunit|nr:FdhF/YdeP family oxidoreductase [Candidatus Acidoferrum sp.]